MTKQGRIRARLTAAIVLACAAHRAAPAAAQDPPPPLLPVDPPAPPPAPPAVTPPEPPSPREPRRESARTLEGLAFATPFLIDTAFVQTHAGFGLELGHQWELGVVPSVLTSGAGAMVPFQYDRSLGVTTQYLSLGVAIGERVELGFSAGYATLLSGDVNATLFFGGKSTWNLRPGARVRLLHKPRAGTQLSLHVYGDLGASAWQNPAGVLAEIAAEAQQLATSTAQITCLQSNNISCALVALGFNAATATYTSRAQYGAGGTLSLAQAIVGGFGVQAAVGFEVDYASGSAVDYASASVAALSYGSVPAAFHVGAAPSVDLGPTVPLTFMGEYLFTLIRETTVYTPENSMGVSADTNTLLTLENAVVGGAYYTGRRDLVIGALFSATFDRITATGSDGTTLAQPPLTRIAGQVTARYFF